MTPNEISREILQWLVKEIEPQWVPGRIQIELVHKIRASIAKERDRALLAEKQAEVFRAALEETVKELAGFEICETNYWKDELLVRAWKRAKAALAQRGE